MRLLVNMSASSEFNEDISIGFIDISQELAKTILRRRKDFLKAHDGDGSLLRMDYYDSDFVYLDHPELDKDDEVDCDLKEEIKNEGFVKTELDLSKNPATVEMDGTYMRVFEDGICFFGYQPYSDVEYYSDSIEYNEIEKAL